MKFDTLPQHLKDALFRMARESPTRWKARVRSVWEGRRVLADAELHAALITVRNLTGPSWLNRLSLRPRRAARDAR